MTTALSTNTKRAITSYSPSVLSHQGSYFLTPRQMKNAAACYMLHARCCMAELVHDKADANPVRRLAIGLSSEIQCKFPLASWGSKS